MKKIKTEISKLLLLAVAAVICLCSCSDAGKQASDIFSAVLDSAGNEISDALDEGIHELTDGLNEVTKGIDEINNNFRSISEEIKSKSESLDSLADDISIKIDEGISKGSDIISSLNDTTTVTDIPETSISSDDTTTAPVKQYKFRNKTRYDEHYEKHGKEFGNITKEEYLSLANDLINSTSDRVLHKMSKDGDYLYFDQDTGYFLVLSDDGYIRTFFIPDKGIAYYDKQ